MVKRFIVILALVVTACARHDDVPPPLEVMTPPTPKNLVVETVDQLTYDLSWEIDDPAVVKEYRIYSEYGTSGPQLEGTTDTTTIQVISPVALSGLVFCVSAVTLENVESALTCGTSE